MAHPQGAEVGPRAVHLRPRLLLAVLICSAALGLTYVVIVPPGLPYDEPSHWLNVLFYLEHQRLPVVGEAGVTYEAQMGPAAYIVLACVALPFSLLSNEAAFYAARSVGVLELLALVFVVWRLVGRALPDRGGAAELAAAAAGLNPMLLVMSASVQNDTLALLLASLALDVATSRPPLSQIRVVVVGVLIGLALLTKITMWPVPLVLGLWLVWRRKLIQVLVLTGSALVVSGWWFIRNLRLYGDLSGKSGVDSAGYSFPALGLDPAHLIREVVTYSWIPVEYVRNTVSAPPIVEVVVLLLMVVSMIGAGAAARWATAPGPLLGAVAAVAIGGWLATTVAVQAVAFRFAYAALLALFMSVGCLALLRPRRVLGAGVVLCLLLLNCWFIWEVLDLRAGNLLDLG